MLSKCTQWLVSALLMVLVCLSFESFAQVYTNPNEADEDFALQGEYSGTIESGNGSAKLGVQVIALGDGLFRAVGYMGGLPGDGWNEEEPERIEAKRENDTVVFTGEHATGTLNEGKITITHGEETLGELNRIERKSETLGKAPPDKAVVLFDGSSADGFVSPKGGAAKMTEDGLLMQGANSKHRFSDCHLHIEFRLPYQPKSRGQGRGNSGVYLQGRYEVQMLDSFGLTGEHNECGGLYTIKKPDLNMCYPPLAWQTYDIDYVAAKYDEQGEKTANARMTVRHNGVLIHEDVELPKTTTGAPMKDSVDKGFLHLQNHGNPVRYRNIWLVEK